MGSQPITSTLTYLKVPFQSSPCCPPSGRQSCCFRWLNRRKNDRMVTSVHVQRFLNQNCAGIVHTGFVALAVPAERCRDNFMWSCIILGGRDFFTTRALVGWDVYPIFLQKRLARTRGKACTVRSPNAKARVSAVTTSCRPTPFERSLLATRRSSIHICPAEKSTRHFNRVTSRESHEARGEA